PIRAHISERLPVPHTADARSPAADIAEAGLRSRFARIGGKHLHRDLAIVVPLQLAATEWCDYSRTEAAILSAKAILRAEGLMAAKRKSATKKKSTTKARKKVGKVMHEYKHGELK